jgi:hypothetical protein
MSIVRGGGSAAEDTAGANAVVNATIISQRVTR